MFLTCILWNEIQNAHSSLNINCQFHVFFASHHVYFACAEIIREFFFFSLLFVLSVILLSLVCHFIVLHPQYLVAPD
jgi:hypothetical protein